MKYKEFVGWCNDRACDGCWSIRTSMYCIEIINKINQEPFWQRNKKWRKIYENTVVYGVVNPINEKIRAVNKLIKEREESK